MGLFAVIYDATVVDDVVISGTVNNIIVANSLAEAEAVSAAPCIEYTTNDETNMPHIGLAYENGLFKQPPVYLHEMVDPSLYPNREIILIEE